MADYITGKVKVFKGDLYTGGFEQNGKVLMKSVLVKVLVIKMARQIPAEGHDEKFVFSD